jgi:hypothetical protein
MIMRNGTPSTKSRNRNCQSAKVNAPEAGNPHPRRDPKMRSTLLSKIEIEEVQRSVRKLLKKAIAGDINAIKEFFDLALGKAY